jgi:hypothetical protein
VAAAYTGRDDERDLGKEGKMTTTRTLPGRTLLDAVLPTYDFRGTTATPIHATPERIFQALRLASTRSVTRPAPAQGEVRLRRDLGYAKTSPRSTSRLVTGRGRHRR